MAKRAVRCGWATPDAVVNGADTCHSLATAPASQVALAPDLSSSSAEELYLTPFIVAEAEAEKPAASNCCGMTGTGFVELAVLAIDIVRVALAAMLGIMADRTA